MSTPDKSPSKRPRSKTSYHQRGTFLHRLDVRLPWLKLIAVVIIGAIIISDLSDLTISKIPDPENFIQNAPMSRHAKITERTLEGKMLVALTFDDGPSSETTPQLLDLLTEKDAPVTFFMLGSMARANPDIVKRIKKEHHEIASHTMYHQNLVRITDSAIRADIGEANSVFTSILGQGPSYTRPPYGNTNATIVDTVGNPIILWSVDTEDWRNKNTDAIVSTAMGEVYDGAIILMHDIYPTSVEAVPALIDTLRQNGYELATISELAAARHLNLVPGEIYYNLLP